ncbi:MAG: protein kinase domain-containing protein [Myxococcales bacterium]|jgi:serine/threonine protein kinase
MRKPIPFGKYLLLERVNVGGMAEVFLAKAFGVEGFERLLAIKRILPTMVEDDEFITMFLDEARISVQLNHANIVQIHELGKHDESYYIAMEYVSGKDVRHLLERCRKRREVMPTAQAVFITTKICEGLDHAHRKKDARGMPLNIIHRDVSPQNILVSYQGDVKIIDFGIAKAANRAQKTQAGILKGKFGYMSPEQVRGLPIDHRSDIFAVGVILYEMLTGERLFVGESDFSTLEKVRNAEVLPPREYNPNIPVGLEKVVLKALARDPDERYQWCSDLQEDLLRYLLAGDSVYTSKHLASYLVEAFVEDYAREAERLERFALVERPELVEVSGVTASPQASARKISSVEINLPPEPLVSPPRLQPSPVPSRQTPPPRLSPQVSPPRLSPQEPVYGDPYNPHIPPPDPEELEDMPSDRTEIYRPVFHQPQERRSSAGTAPRLLGDDSEVTQTPVEPGGRDEGEADMMVPAHESEGETMMMPPPDAGEAETVLGLSAVRPEENTNPRIESAETVVGYMPPPRRKTPLRPAPPRLTRTNSLLGDEAGAARQPPAVSEDVFPPEDESTPDHGPPALMPSGRAGRRTPAAQPQARRSLLVPLVAVTALAALGVVAALLFLKPGATAKLAVLTLPSTAEVVVDGNPVRPGDTVVLTAGEHEVAIRASGFKPHVERVQLGVNDLRTLKVRLKPAAADDAVPDDAPGETGEGLAVEEAGADEPGIEGGLAGEEAGADESADEDGSAGEEATPAQPPGRVALQEGNASEKQAVAGPQASADADRVPGQMAKPKPEDTPRQNRVSLKVESEPSGATVEIDGRRVGRTPVTLNDVDPDAIKAVTVSASGYKSLSQPIYWDGASSEVSVYAILDRKAEKPARPAKPKPKPKAKPKGFGKLVTISSPVAQVFVDGKDTGRWTPIPNAKPLEIPAGKHTITYKAADGRKATRVVTVEVGETVKVVGVSDFK